MEVDEEIKSNLSERVLGVVKISHDACAACYLQSFTITNNVSVEDPVPFKELVTQV